MDRPNSGDIPSSAPPPSAAPPPISPPARWVSWRSVLLGSLGVVLVCGMTPFNDYVVANTYMVGSYLPLVVVVSFFVLIVLVNAPLHRLMPGRALAPGELAVIMLMMLVSCTIPSTGLMRYLPGVLIGPAYYGSQEPRFWNVLVQLELPAWLFPVPLTEEGPASPVVHDFYGRVQEGTPIPYRAWLRPLAGWGIFLCGAFATLVALAVLLRPQWAQNERLPFPLAQLQIALIEPPRPGHLLNDLFASRAFWIALCGVFVLQGLVALHAYHPRYVPQLPLEYDLTEIMAEEPWVHFAPLVKSGRVFFTFIGITYFIQSRISFSLWSIFLITQVIAVQARMMQTEIPFLAWQEQHLGASIAFAIGILWIGRHHLAMITRQTLRGRRPGEPQGDFLSYRTAALLALGGVGVMMVWLHVVGVQLWVSMLIVAFLLVVHLVAGRVVAETGMPIIRIFSGLPQVYTNVSPQWMGGRDIFFAHAWNLMGSAGTREGLFGYSMHGLQVADSTHPPNRHRKGMIALIGWALVLGFIVAGSSTLTAIYTHATPITTKVQTVVNEFGTEGAPQMHLVQPLMQHSTGRYPPKQYSSWTHIGIGAGVTAALQAAALRWSSWPFVPVGYLLSSTWHLRIVWFSLFIGWLCKVLLVRFGGPGVFRRARPFFVGLIFGEMIAAGVWLGITLMLAGLGYDYEVINFLPH